MGIFDSLGRGQAVRGQGIQNGPRNPIQMLQMLKRNPIGIVHQAGFTIPNGMTDARQITKYLLDSGQVGQNQISAIQNAVSGRRR